jgi:NADH-quinone oxidoreductase subunit N
MNALLVVSGLAILALIAEIFNFKKWLTPLVILGLTAAAVLLQLELPKNYGFDLDRVKWFSDMLVFSESSGPLVMLVIVVSILWFWMSSEFLKGHHQTDRTALVLLSVAGAICMAAYEHMAMLFLGIEILSISLYALAGSKHDSLSSTEAAFKYFLMGSFASGFLLFGIALLYGATGSFSLSEITGVLMSPAATMPSYFYLGVMMMMVGFAFKMSAVPFHFWAPDVYEGSPTHVTALMSTVAKIAAIAAFYPIFTFTFAPARDKWGIVLQVITILTLVVPNVTAVFQNSVKRMLAYSSVGHVGYILLAFAGPNEAISDARSLLTIYQGVFNPVYFYLAAYAISSLAAFSVLAHVENSMKQTSVNAFKGFFKKDPMSAVLMAVSLMSLAGIPPMAGFFGKYLVFTQAINQGYTGMVLVAVVTSLIGVYYYFRVLIAMFQDNPDSGTELRPVSVSGRILQVVFLLLLLGMGLM